MSDLNVYVCQCGRTLCLHPFEVLDCCLELEIAVDAVLSRYEIPLDLSPHGDRGDLASDLASEARRVLAHE